MKKILSMLLIVALLVSLVTPINTYANTTLEGKIVSGETFTFALMPDGTVKAWGRNDGRLGLGDTPNRNYPTTIPGLVGVKDIAVGSNHAIALMNDGTLKSWGINFSGQLGFGDTVARNVPTTIPGISGVKEISVKGDTNFAVMTNGTVQAWGNNYRSVLGLGDAVLRKSPTIVPALVGVNSIVAGKSHTIAVMLDGSVKSWGYNFFGQLGLGDNVDKTIPTLISGLTGYSKIVVTDNSTYALMSNGTVKSWGLNSSGQLGLSDTTNRNIPTTIPGLNGVKDVSASGLYAHTVMNDNTVKAWGINASYQFGNGNTVASIVPITVTGLTGVKTIIPGSVSNFALMLDGSLKSWGQNYYGQLGLGENIDKTTPTSVSGFSVSLQPVAPTVTASTTGLTNQNVVVYAVFSVDSTIKEYSKDNGAWTAYASGVTFTANGIVKFRGGSSGGYSPEISYTVSNIDKTPPTNPIIVANTIVPTNTNVATAITYSGDSVVKEYRTNGGAWMAYTVQITFTANGTIEARSQDNAGNWSTTATYSVSNIDKTAPVITIETYTTTPINSDIVVNASTNEGTLNITSKIFTANGSFEFIATDIAGNVTKRTVTITNIDKTAPTTPVIVADKTGPANTEVTTTVTFSADSLLKQYRVNGGAWTVYTTPITFSVNGTVEARSQDDAGNWSVIANYVVTNIDKIAPNAPVIVANKTNPTNTDVATAITYSADSVAKEYRMNGGAWTAYTTPITFTVNGTVEARSQDDAGNWSTVATYSVSNIDKIAPIITIAPYTTMPINTDIVVMASTNEGTLNVTSKSFTANDSFDFIATDSAGNVTTRTVTITNIDKTAPTTPVIVADKTGPSNTEVVTTITYSVDSVAKEHRVNGGTWTTYTTPITFSANGTIEARSQDDAGNWSVIANYDVSNIDKIAPVITITPYTTTPINTDIVVTASTNEGTLNVTSKTFTANGTFDFIATDSAGNITTRTVTITNIDKTAPITPVIVANKTTPTNADVTTAIIYSGDSIEIEYSVNGGAWTAYTTPVTFSDNGTIEARSKDDAGNWSTVANYALTNIDKIAPTVPTMSIIDSNVLKIVSGTDAEFGVNHVEYLLNGGTWTVYDTAVELVDGNYSVESRTLDNAGNYSDITSEDYVIYKSRLADAEEAVVQAEASVTQVAVDNARDKVALLPSTTPEKVTLTLRLDVVQAKVDNNALVFELDLMKYLLVNRQADNRLDEFTVRLAEMRAEVSGLTLLTNTSVTTTKINQVEKVIKAIKSLIVAEGSYNPEDTYDAGNDVGDIGDPAVEEALQQQVLEANNVILAIKAVEKAEATKLALDISSAWTAIKIISTEPIKGQLIARMNAIDHVFVKAEKAVANAEKYKTSSSINTAINQVKLVSNDNPRKESIITRLEIVRLEYNRAVILKDTAKLKRDAIYYVEQAESFGTVFYNAKAQFYVDLLDGIDEVLQAELQTRLDVTKGLLTTASSISHTVRMATKYVETAETYKTPELIATAQGYVNLITNDNTAKAELQARLDSIQ